MSASSSTSKPFELGPQRLLGLAGIVGVAAGAVALWQSPDSYASMALLTLNTLLLIVGFKAIGQENKLLDRLNGVLTEAAQGQLEARITQIPDKGRLIDAAWRVNDVLDQIESDLLPSESEFAGRLVRPRATGQTPKLEATEEDLKRFTANKPQEAEAPRPAPVPLPSSYPPLEPAAR